MASEYFSTLQYIWLNIVFFVFSLFLFAVCLYACLFVRWVYKRRLRQKTDEMIDAYKGEENKRKEIELNLKRQELEFPEKKKKGSSKPRNIHIVTKPCNHIIQKNSRELIVKQVNETPNDEVACEVPGHHPPQQAPPPQQLPIVNPHQIRTMDQFQQQYVLVPVEMMSSVVKVRKSRSTAPPHQNRLSVESVATQTSDRSSSDDEGSSLERQNSEDWLTGFDEKDGERIDVDEEEYDEQESERFMRRRREFDEKNGSKKWQTPPPPPPAEVASDEVRVSIESDASPPKDSTDPPSSRSPGFSENDANPLAGPGVPDPKRTGSPGAKKASGSQTAPGGAKRSPDKKNPGSGSSAPGSTAPPGSGTSGSAPPAPGSGVEDSKDSKDSKDPKAASNGDKSYVASQYFGQPGENLSALSSNPPVPKSSSPAARPSIFPYFVDPKAPSPSVSTSKASSKLTDPEQENTDSSCALYRDKKKKMATDSKKVYNNGTPKAKTPQ